MRSNVASWLQYITVVDNGVLYKLNPLTVVKKLHPNPVLRGPHGPRGLFQVKCYFKLYYAYHGFKATVLEAQTDIQSGVHTDSDKILQF